MFHLQSETTVHLRKFSKREEIHGKDMIPAIDLSCSYKAPAAVLDMMHPQLREALFTNKPTKAGDSLDLPIDDMPFVRAPLIEMPLNLDYEMAGCGLRVHYGASEKSHVVLALVRAHKFKLVERVEGGMVELQFTLSCANQIDEKVIGKLGILGGHDIAITLTAPEMEDEKADPGNDPAWPFPKTDKPPKAKKDELTPEKALADSVGAEG